MKKTAIFTTFILILSSINITNAGFLDFLSWSKYSKDNIFRKLDSWMVKVEDAVLEVNLKWNDKAGDMSEAISEYALSMWQNIKFKNVTKEKLLKIYNEEDDALKVLVSIVETEDKDYFTTDQILKIVKIIQSYVKISKQNAGKQTENMYKLVNVWLYSDWNTDNSPFDLIEDLDDINAMLYWEEDKYWDFWDESGNTWNLEDLFNNSVSYPSQYEHKKNNKQAELNITQANIWQNVKLNPETIDAIELVLWNLKVMTFDEFRAKFIEILNDLNVKPEIRDWIIDLLDNVLSTAKLKENIENILKWIWVDQNIIDKVKEIVDVVPDLWQMKDKILEVLKEAWLEQDKLDLVEDVFDNIWIPTDVIDKIDKLLQQAWIDKPARDNLRTFLESYKIDKTLQEQADYIWWELRCAINKTWLSMKALDIVDNPANRNTELNKKWEEWMIDYLKPWIWLWEVNWGKDWPSANNWTWVYNPFWETFPCSPTDIFCILVSMKSYSLNMVWQYKEDDWWSSTAKIISKYNENFKKWAYSSLSQKRMAINNFEFGYPLDLQDLFSTWVYLSKQPIPMYNIEDEDNEWKTNSFPDDVADKERLLKWTFQAYWLDYNRQNNLTLLSKDLYKTTNLTNSSSRKLWKVSDEDHKLEDMIRNNKNALKKIELDIEKLTSEQSDFSDLNLSFMQLNWIFGWLKNFAKYLGWVSERMTKIPYK